MMSDETKLGLFLGTMIVGGILVARWIQNSDPGNTRAATYKDKDNNLEKRYFTDGTWKLYDTSSRKYKIIDSGTWDTTQPVPTQ